MVSVPCDCVLLCVNMHLVLVLARVVVPDLALSGVVVHFVVLVPALVCASLIPLVPFIVVQWGKPVE